MRFDQFYSGVDTIALSPEPDIHNHEVRLLYRSHFDRFLRGSRDSRHFKARCGQAVLNLQRYEVIIFDNQNSRWL